MRRKSTAKVQVEEANYQDTIKNLVKDSNEELAHRYTHELLMLLLQKVLPLWCCRNGIAYNENALIQTTIKKKHPAANLDQA